MTDKHSVSRLFIHLATPADIAQIEYLDSFSASPTRDIHRDMQKYFGSVDPSTHERTLIFLAESDGKAVAKAELMLPPNDSLNAVGYVKRVIVHPDARGQGLARQLLEHVITFARTEQHLESIDLHVWDQNTSAIQLYEKLGFELKHRELYYRLPL
ncbi:GNAT family N-acetyltransferase [Tengunoibacter tsumagoiensis]|uniref:N-acetyltransferase domain-containing protein n=1 Tax=Tengunoibacter tsumagoiensis TaxID=2014871 RepID=A0A402A2R1_9CHLR|nr:GNAT family N-acetyltransferase [Tengunoibacter tsumagoiensis]GCE13362.1 hypothetical protein KTT_32210 [Tengunoibacter tsumagoiensis]